MKLRIYFRPAFVLLLLGLAAALAWAAAALLTGATCVIAMVIAAFYTVLSVLAGLAVLRLGVLESWQAWDAPGRLLILAPHEDDCVIAAGGIGARNRRLGGVTRIVYLAPDETPGLAERRSTEARAAWSLAGVTGGDISHLDLLPPLRTRDPARLHAAAAALRSIIDDFEPTAVVVPMFEGGHVQHDMTAAIVGTILQPGDRFDVFEAPEYSPYASLWDTPHRVIALCSRWLFGLVSYYGPPDGIGGRQVRKYRLDAADLDCKRRMLAAFVSQNAPSLVATRAYPDRLLFLDRNVERRRPFAFERSYLRFVLAVRDVLPARLVDRVFPVQLGTIGREPGITDWPTEWNAASDRDACASPVDGRVRKPGAR
jgi:LmbE family N-acetylglucosaminyl deacetylase